MNEKAALLFLMSFSFIYSASGQNNLLEEAIEQYAEETDENIEDDTRILALERFLNHPLNLNIATKEDMETFFFLNKLQIQSFIKYRNLLGPFINIYELQTIPNWDLETIKNILPFITIHKRKEPEAGLNNLMKRLEPQLLFRYKRTLERQKGYRPKDSLGNTHFLGSPGAAYFRAQFKIPGYLNLGVTAESDAGESFTKQGQKGFDFYSFHFYLKNKGWIRDLALGDYRISLGQGLINQQGLTFGKTGMVMNIDRSGKTIRPHTSAMENGFYRGAAIRLGKSKWSSTLFLSSKSEDAHLYEVDSTRKYFRSLQNSGYHRSESEVKNKNTVNIKSAGGNVKYDFGKGHIGLNVVYHHFSDSMGKSNQPYQLYRPTGFERWNGSVDYSFYMDKLYLFGETATDKKGNIATINGLLMSVDRKVDLSLSYRNYSMGYAALYGKSFGEGSRPENESGFYLGAAIRPATHWEINIYSDFFQSKWLKYRVDAPSTGREHFLQVNYKPSKEFLIYTRYRYKNKPINLLKESNPLADVVITQKQNLRLFMQWKLSDNFRIRNQLDGVYFKKGEEKPETGWMFYQNVKWETNRAVSGNFRLGYFHTGGYDARIYTFENNVRYAFYVPAFFGKGIRSYCNIRVNIGHHLTLWSRIAATWYFDQESVGSGWNEIKGNRKTDFTLELIWE